MKSERCDISTSRGKPPRSLARRRTVTESVGGIPNSWPTFVTKHSRRKRTVFHEDVTVTLVLSGVADSSRAQLTYFPADPIMGDFQQQAVLSSGSSATILWDDLLAKGTLLKAEHLRLVAEAKAKDQKIQTLAMDKLDGEEIISELQSDNKRLLDRVDGLLKEVHHLQMVNAQLERKIFEHYSSKRQKKSHVVTPDKGARPEEPTQETKGLTKEQVNESLAVGSTEANEKMLRYRIRQRPVWEGDEHGSKES